MSSPRFLNDSGLRLILFGGKGGVGKTSCAAAAALRLARRDPARQMTLVSTDPAHSLHDSLGGGAPPRNLSVIELDAREHLEAFKREHGPKLREIAARGTFLDDEDIARFMDLSLPGMDELFAFLEIARWVEQRPELDVIIVDTAPTGHTLRLLGMPDLLERWVEALDSLLAKHRYMKQIFGRGYRRDELDEFLEDLSGSVASMRAILKDASRCQFVPVMIAEELSVRETAGLLQALQRLEVAAGDVVVNRLVPESPCPVCVDMRARQLRELNELPPDFTGRVLWGVPLFPYEVRGVDRLDAFFQAAYPLVPEAGTASREAVATPRPSVAASVTVEHPAAPPAPSLRLLLFAGKGGVGKTTLACATALRLAQASPEKRILLFSTDPAHSLSDCLEQSVGARPKRVSAGLDALEIDAEAELAALKQQYRAELDEFLRTVLGNLDLTFDRPVMERMLDLSPPGIDEIMALTRAMELLSGRDYELLIVDAAPTGHLIRLLEMPTIVDQWLKAFFELFLKYRNVFQVPSISERLVEMSRSLRQLRRLLGDPAGAALYAVSILTDMAFEETKDLLAACARLHVAAPVVFFNMVTPKSGCELCDARARQEERTQALFSEVLSGKASVTVYWQPEPRGVPALTALGKSLYATAHKPGDG